MTTPADNPDDGSLSWQWRLTVLTQCHVVGTMHSVSVWAMAPFIREELSLTSAQFGLFVSAYYGAQTVSAFPAGGFVDRIGVGRSLVLSMIILSVGAIALSNAGSLGVALASMAIMGLGYALVNPASARGVLNWFRYERRATAMGVKQTGVPIGGVLAAGCGILATVVDWRVVLWTVAGITIANIMFCLPLLKIPSSAKTTGALLPVKEIVGILKDRNITLFGFINTFLQIGQANFFAYLTLFLRDVAAASQPLASACLGIAQVMSAVGRVGWGVMCDRFFQGRRARLVVLITLVAGVALLAMALISPATAVVLGIGLSAILGITIAAYAALTLTIGAETVEPSRAGTAVGYNLMMVCLGGVIGPPLFGYALDHLGGYRAGWYLTGAIVLIGVALLNFVFRERRPD